MPVCILKYLPASAGHLWVLRIHRFSGCALLKKCLEKFQNEPPCIRPLPSVARGREIERLGTVTGP